MPISAIAFSMCVWNILAILRLSGEILAISIGNDGSTLVPH
jgi:hypothetical protein